MNELKCTACGLENGKYYGISTKSYPHILICQNCQADIFKWAVSRQQISFTDIFEWLRPRVKDLNKPL